MSRARRRAMGALRWLHRWTSIAFGLALLVETTTGCVLLFRADLFRATHPALYAATPASRPLGTDRALQLARRYDPSLGAGALTRNGGVYLVWGSGLAAGRAVHIDPGSGRVLGEADHYAGVMGLLANVHECGLTCAWMPGYVPALRTPVPGLSGEGGAPLTVADTSIGAVGLLAAFLAVSGAILWWPGVWRLGRGLQVRLGRGRYARDYDLHKAIGVLGLVFLLMWGVTGAQFELPFVGNLWLGALGGSRAPSPASRSGPGPDIGLGEAEARALAAAGGGRVTWAELPAAAPASVYYVGIASGFDERWTDDYPGNVQVMVDRRSGQATVRWGGTGSPASRSILAQWWPAVHTGWFLAAPARLIWLLFGLAPLVLAATGLSTWLWKRARRRSRFRLDTNRGLP